MTRQPVTVPAMPAAPPATPRADGRPRLGRVVRVLHWIAPFAVPAWLLLASTFAGGGWETLGLLLAAPVIFVLLALGPIIGVASRRLRQAGTVPTVYAWLHLAVWAAVFVAGFGIPSTSDSSSTPAALPEPLAVALGILAATLWAAGLFALTLGPLPARVPGTPPTPDAAASAPAAPAVATTSVPSAPDAAASAPAVATASLPSAPAGATASVPSAPAGATASVPYAPDAGRTAPDDARNRLGRVVWFLHWVTPFVAPAYFIWAVDAFAVHAGDDVVIRFAPLLCPFLLIAPVLAVSSRRLRRRRAVPRAYAAWHIVLWAAQFVLGATLSTRGSASQELFGVLHASDDVIAAMAGASVVVGLAAWLISIAALARGLDR